MNYTPIMFNNKTEREDYFRKNYTNILGELVVNTMISDGFLTAPASTHFHGNYEGGLFDHSANVAEMLGKLTLINDLKWKGGSSERSPWVVGILHDLCKIDQYRPVLNETDDVIPGVYEWNKTPLLKGHGTKSAIYAQSIGARLSQEEIACIVYHMGAFTDSKEWDNYNHAIEVYPNVLWTHTADMIVSKCMEV